jgi:hypothetical protein
MYSLKLISEHNFCDKIDHAYYYTNLENNKVYKKYQDKACRQLKKY